MTTAPFITASGLSLLYSTNTSPILALTGIDLSISRGEIISIVGSSGCGKTTLLRLIAGLLPPTSGSISLCGNSPMIYRAKNPVGFLFQKPVLFPWRTIKSNVLLPSEIWKNGDSNDFVEGADRLLTRLGLEEFLDVYPSQLSGGMLQRAALARALIINPSLLLLDEPFSALDEITREQLWVEFRKVWAEKGLTVVIVTHSIKEAVFLGDRVLIMSQRPGNILGEVDISFAGEREHAFTTKTVFTELCEKVRIKLQ